MKNYKYIFFDLDGTLLDTLNDIVYAINKTMEQFSYDLRFDYEIYLSFLYLVLNFYL